MSTAFPKKDSEGFQERLISVCGTKNPRAIADYFGVTYQAAKNYLNGRLPEARVLVRLAEKTPVSLHWLLTGEGEKFVDASEKTDAELLVSILSELADPKVLRKIFEIISGEKIRQALEAPVVPVKAENTKTVTIRSDQIRSEKESDEEINSRDKKAKTIPASTKKGE